MTTLDKNQLPLIAEKISNAAELIKGVERLIYKLKRLALKRGYTKNQIATQLESNTCILLAVSQNQPVMVGIKGVKTSHFMERKTAPRDNWETVPMERVQRPQSELANNDLQFSRPRMVPATHSERSWDQSRNGWSVFAVGKTSHFDRRV
jgi:hypothetical protein